MLDILRRFVRQIGQTWSNMGILFRVLTGGVVLALLLVLGVLGYNAMQPNYRVLISDVSVEEAGQIKSRLDAQGATYQLADGGTTFLVEADRLHELRMDLAVAGLPSINDSYSLFDNQSALGTTQFQNQLTLLRATQGELERTIMTLDPVDHARVHIVYPEETPFVRLQDPVTASVVLTPKRGEQISRSVSDGIVSLVSGAVKGLKSEHVTVLDNEGRRLTKKQDPASGMANDQLDLQRSVEEYLAGKAEDLLTRAMGYQNAVVKVSAVLDFNKVKEISETYNPDGRALHHEISDSEKAEGGGGPGGVVGTTANVPPVIQPGGQGGGGQSSEREKVVSDYLVTRVQRWQEDMIGAVTRMSVSVLLIPDPPAAGDAADPQQPPPDPETLLPFSKLEAEEQVKNAIGFSQVRGDTIAVTVSKPIVTAAIQEVGEDLLAIERYKQISHIVMWVSAVLAIIMLPILLGMFLRYRRRRAEMEAEARAAAGTGPGPVDLSNLESVASALRMWLEEA